MSDFYDDLERQSRETREADLFARLGPHLQAATEKFSGLADHLSGCGLDKIDSRAALAELPVLRKKHLMDAQKKNPPFGGFARLEDLAGSRLFLSPGPVWEPQGFGADPWGAARSLHAAGVRKGDLVHNALAYHMTPGGFILDEGARALGCIVFPAGIGNSEIQMDAIETLKPSAFVGTPDYLKILMDAADKAGKDLSSIKRALVSGGALFPSLRAEYAKRGVQVMQAYATADLGVIAYETKCDENVLDGMVANENLIIEICRPGTAEPVQAGQVGELVVTNFSLDYPLVRFATGDLSALMDEPSPCGRTNMRIKGWMGRADQRTKIKGMFVDPEQIDMLVKKHPEIAAARLVVRRQDNKDDLRLLVEQSENSGAPLDEAAIADSLREITKLGGTVEPVDEIANDGKIISDERDYEEN